MPKRFSGALYALSILSPAAAFASEPLQPSGQWGLDFGDHQCLATRSYGVGDYPYLFALKPSPNGAVFQLSIVQKLGQRPEFILEDDAQVTVGTAPPLKVSALKFHLKNSDTVTYRINIPADKALTLRQADSIKFDFRHDHPLTISLSKMPVLMNMMDDCLKGLRHFWNADVTLKTELIAPDLHTLFKPEDYPADAMYRHATGSVYFTLLVDEAGKVADCTVTKTSNVAMLDVQTCIIAERAKFIPATGQDGKPAKDMYSSHVSWNIGH